MTAKSTPEVPAHRALQQTEAAPAVPEDGPTELTVAGESEPVGVNDVVAAIGSIPGRLASHFRGTRLRLLPTIIFVAVLMIGVRFGDLWNAVANQGQLAAVSTTLAEATEDEGPDVESVLPDDADTPLDTAAAATMATPASEEAADHGAAEAEGGAPEAEPELPRRFDVSQLTDSEVAVLHNLSERREQLDTREAELDQRAAMLSVAEQRVDEKLAELDALSGHIEGLLTQLSAARDGQLDSLVSIYEAMRPSDAAAIFNGLEMEVILSVFERMAERKSAPILAAMNPERAREVTSELALRQGIDLEIPELE